jgi:hypothetical protein
VLPNKKLWVITNLPVELERFKFVHIVFPNRFRDEYGEFNDNFVKETRRLLNTGGTTLDNFGYQTPRDFLSSVIGSDSIQKLAAMLKQESGIFVISGDACSGKSILVRLLHRVFPSSSISISQLRDLPTGYKKVFLDGDSSDFPPTPVKQQLWITSYRSVDNYDSIHCSNKFTPGPGDFTDEFVEWTREMLRRE